MNCIPIGLCELVSKELALTVVYGFGAEPMFLLSNLKMQEKKKLYHIITKVYICSEGELKNTSGLRNSSLKGKI